MASLWGKCVFRLEYKWLVGITFVLGLIMQILDMTVLNVALATLGREFRVGEATLQWVLTGYLVSLAVFVPSSGWIADRFGPKRTFQTAVVVFTAASVLCGLAGAMWMLIGARVLQGIGGGMLAPVGQAMLFRAFPAHERAKASAVLAVPVTIAPTLGPLLGLDRHRDTDLLDTLRTWLAHHGGWEPTATALGVHRNSVRHRIAQAERALGTDLADPETRMNLWFALHHLPR